MLLNDRFFPPQSVGQILDEIDAGTRLDRNKDVSAVHAIRAASHGPWTSFQSLNRKSDL